MQNGDIISVGRGLFVKMFITLKPHGIFCTNFAYLSVHFNIVQNGDEASPRISPTCCGS